MSTRFEGFPAVNIHVAFFWVVKPRILVRGNGMSEEATALFIYTKDYVLPLRL
jgi:hypothetical protein